MRRRKRAKPTTLPKSMKLTGLKLLYEHRGVTTSVSKDGTVAKMDIPGQKRKVNLAIPREVAILRGVDRKGIRFIHRVGRADDGTVVSEIIPLDKLKPLRWPSEKEERRVFGRLEEQGVFGRVSADK